MYKKLIPTVLTILSGIFISSFIYSAESKDILQIKLRKNMPYNQARKQLIMDGWQHNSLPVYGYQETHPKVKSECFGSVKICNQYPEISSCSGQGYCLMEYFDHFGNKLFLTTYGPLSGDPLVIEWRVE